MSASDKEFEQYLNELERYTYNHWSGHRTGCTGPDPTTFLRI